MAPTAEIAIIDPSTTLRHWAPEMRRQAESDDLGFYQALVEAKLPFEFLSDQMMTPERLDAFKVVILANARCLSDAQCRMLEDYVARGGSVVAAFETSTRDENGKERAGFGLERVFGARLVSPARGPVKNTYVALNGEHPINRGYDGANRIMGGTRLIGVETVDGAGAVPLRPRLPRPADGGGLSPRGAARRRRHRPRHRGRPDRLHPVEHRRHLLGGARRRPRPADRQRRALGARRTRPASRSPARRCSTSRSARTHDGVAVILHNLTNPMMLKGPIREIFPVGPQQVSVALDGKAVGSARLLVAGRDVPVRTEGGRAIVEVPGDRHPRGRAPHLAVAPRWSATSSSASS